MGDLRDWGKQAARQGNLEGFKKAKGQRQKAKARDQDQLKVGVVVV
jgi:hypothetical protein